MGLGIGIGLGPRRCAYACYDGGYVVAQNILDHMGNISPDQPASYRLGRQLMRIRHEVERQLASYLEALPADQAPRPATVSVARTAIGLLPGSTDHDRDQLKTILAIAGFAEPSLLTQPEVLGLVVIERLGLRHRLVLLIDLGTQVAQVAIMRVSSHREHSFSILATKEEQRLAHDAYGIGQLLRDWGGSALRDELDFLDSLVSETLEQHEFDDRDFDRLLLFGGIARHDKLLERLYERFGDRCEVLNDRELWVARGCCAWLDREERRLVTDRNPSHERRRIPPADLSSRIEVQDVSGAIPAVIFDREARYIDASAVPTGYPPGPQINESVSAAWVTGKTTESLKAQSLGAFPRHITEQGPTLWFEIELKGRADGGWNRTARGSLGGDVDDPLPTDLRSLREWADRFGARNLDGHQLRDLGVRMFDALFKGTIEHRYREHCREARALRGTILVRLKMDPAAAGEIFHYPWEYLCDSRGNRFLLTVPGRSFSRLVPLRYVEPRSLPVSAPLNILLVFSSPSGLSPIGGSATWRELVNELSNLKEMGLVDWLPIRNATWTQVSHQLQSAEFQPHVVQFIMHGEYKDGAGCVYFERGHGHIDRVGEADFADLPFPDSVRLIVLTACESGGAAIQQDWSGLAAAVLRTGIPLVVGLRDAITETVASTMSVALYHSLTMGNTIECAVADARLDAQALTRDPRDWGSLLLYTSTRQGQLLRAPRRLHTLNPGVLHVPGTSTEYWQDLDRRNPEEE